MGLFSRIFGDVFNKQISVSVKRIPVSQKKIPEKKKRTMNSNTEKTEEIILHTVSESTETEKENAPEVIPVPEEKSEDKKEEKEKKKDKKKHEKQEKKAYKKELLRCFTNRELSWLDFNERCLNEAGNPQVPLAERLTFASIFQTNLDEFFMVRVGSIMDQRAADPDLKENKTRMTPDEQISAILKQVRVLEKKKGKIYEQLMGELEPQGVRIINFNRLSKSEGEVLERYFDSTISPYLAPMIVDKGQTFPFLNAKELYVIAFLKDKTGKSKIGLIPCANSVFKRLIEIPSRPGTYMLSEELILHFISKFFHRFEVLEKSILRITRNGDIDTNEVYEDEPDLRKAMEILIKQRRFLSPVRVEITRDLSKDTRKILAKQLKISPDHVIKVDTPLDLKYVFTIQDFLKNKPELFYEKRSPRLTNQLDSKLPLIPQIEKKDVLLSYPYNDIKVFLKLLKEAASDPSVVSIKMTLYRVADRSEIVESLIEACENGKEVDVLVELRARFDEENNIDVSKKLEDAGCRIIYGLNGFKVHSKLCLITRSVNGETSYITQLGTGNYNEKTAKLYTDLALITADPNIGQESTEVFNALLKDETVEETKYLLVAPNCLQNKLLDMMDEEIRKAKNGEDAFIGAKINSLTDKKLIEKMIEASQAGVRIELIVRGICCLTPGIPGFTDNITVISIVGRFLEHSRIYRFGTGTDEKIYIASADYMTRNTVRRVEIAAPVYDEALKNRIRHIFEIAMSDDVKGKEKTADGTYVDRNVHMDGEKMNSQEFFYKEAYEEEPNINN